MIVLDASAAIEFLLGTATGSLVHDRIAGVTLHAPHLIDAEVAQVMRRKAASGEIDPVRAREGLTDLADLRMRRYPHLPLLERVWDLRGHVTAYDAMYLALAEALVAPLVTTDARLARAGSGGATVEVLGR